MRIIRESMSSNRRGANFAQSSANETEMARQRSLGVSALACVFMSLAIILLVLIPAVTAGTKGPSASVAASDPGGGDWPMWGGTPDRNMISNMKGLPASWDVSAKKNI